jgi:hypothetical protein
MPSAQNTFLQHPSTPPLLSLAGGTLPLPEYRQIELYTKKKKLNFAPALPAATPEEQHAVNLLALAAQNFTLLDNHFNARDPLLQEGKTSWERYLAIPRTGTLDKIAAEFYRVLRLCHIAHLHPNAHKELRGGLIRLSCEFNHYALSLNITPAGISLVCAAVHLYLDAARQPYSAAYTEALLLQYFADLVSEIRKYADEDRVLYQFRPRFPYFNRHFRFDCDNPRFSEEKDHWHIDISPRFRDTVRYPIDFYLPADEALYIIPVEALQDGNLPLTELPRWQVQTSGGILPAEFALRFSREDMIVGLPMT